MARPWSDSASAVLWGHGAGQVEDLDVEYPANFSAVPKAFLEYGLAGLAAFSALWLAMFLRLAVPREILGALLMIYFIVAGALLQPSTVFFLWALTGGFARRADARHPRWSLKGEPQ
jgi:hypothetical protein